MMKYIILSVLFLLAPFFGGCTAGIEKANMVDGSVISSGDLKIRTRLNNPMFRNRTYAVVKETAVWDMYCDFWKVLYSQELYKWNSRFNCVHIANLFVELCQVQYANKDFNKSPNAEALALAEVWYHPNKNKKGEDHAVVAIYTDNGLLFLEPQTGQFVRLTEEEKRSITYVRW